MQGAQATRAIDVCESEAVSGLVADTFLGSNSKAFTGGIDGGNGWSNSTSTWSPSSTWTPIGIVCLIDLGMLRTVFTTKNLLRIGLFFFYHFVCFHE